MLMLFGKRKTNDSDADATKNERLGLHGTVFYSYGLRI